MAKTILIVDDEQDILDVLQFNLETEGYQILTASNGNDAVQLAQTHSPDLIILDIMLPGKDGWQVIKELKNHPQMQNIPVIFLTAKDSEIDETVGLELGAVDYVVKPIRIRSLSARVKAAFSKAPAAGQDRNRVLRFGDVKINTEQYSVEVDGRPVKFTKKEFNILLYLAQRPGRVISRDTLLNEIWGYDVVVIDRTIDVHIRKIREKLGDKHAHLIETLKGVGYRFKKNN